MTRLSQSQTDQFHEDGYLLVEDAVDTGQLQAMRRDFDQWVEESRQHSEPWGTTVDGRPRFDLASSHAAGSPALRRVNSPAEISQAYETAMRDSAIPEITAELIGPCIRYHHSKINSKLPGAATEVKWHQDFPFTPHTNDDLVTALLFIDEVTPDNGPLEIVPGSHRGPIHSLWHDGVFTAAIDDELADKCRNQAIRCEGSAGACCFMHTRLLHGSAPNLSDKPRTLFITVYASEDAMALSPNPVPSTLDGEIISGTPTGRVRSIAFELELPQKPHQSSFFEQQSEAAARG